MAHIIFDLETAPIDDAATYLTDPVEAPQNYKDPEKIEAYIARARLKQLEQCSLEPDLCRIIALGYLRTLPGGAVHRYVECCQDATHETAALTAFWMNYAASDTLVTYNGIGFDLPVLLRRSLYLGVKTPRTKFTRYQYYEPVVIDLMQLLSHYGLLTYRSLNFYSARFGLTPQDDDITGADVQRCLKAGQWDTIAKHCGANVQQTYELAQKLGVIP